MAIVLIIHLVNKAVRAMTELLMPQMRGSKEESSTSIKVT